MFIYPRYNCSNLCISFCCLLLKWRWGSNSLLNLKFCHLRSFGDFQPSFKMFTVFVHCVIQTGLYLQNQNDNRKPLIVLKLQIILRVRLISQIKRFCSQQFNIPWPIFKFHAPNLKEKFIYVGFILSCVKYFPIV